MAGLQGWVRWGGWSRGVGRPVPVGELFWVGVPMGLEMGVGRQQQEGQVVGRGETQAGAQFGAQARVQVLAEILAGGAFLPLGAAGPQLEVVG
jgi:hypothetical protein